MRLRFLPLICLLSCAGAGLDDAEFEQEPAADEYSTLEQGLITCNFRNDTGYRSGNPFTLTLVTVDGMPVEVGTANAFAVMQAAAASQGVAIRINDGFRSPQEQAYYYSCYVNCNCNDCNNAAAPGYSNHQSGSALDLNTASGGVYDWLAAHGGAYGFQRTVPSERWHWEYTGGGPGGGPCSQSCDRSAGPLSFSCDGVQPNMACVNVNEPGDPNTWGDNYFCTTSDIGLKWSSQGPIADMDCTGVNESAELYAAAWSDNFLCAPKQSPWTFSYSSAGPIAGRNCVQWNEPSDPHSWSDNYVCTTSRSEFTNGQFTFTMNGPRAGKTCVLVDEPSDPDTWNDNFFCSETDIGMKWSFRGPIDGMACTNVSESAEAQPTIWADNYLCVPTESRWRLTWSSAGPIAGKTCIRWFENSETSATWLDNWMCVEERYLSTPIVAPPVIITPIAVPVIAEEVAGEGGAVAGETTAGEVPMTAMHLESTGCSTGSAQLALFAAVSWLLRRRSERSRFSGTLNERSWSEAEDAPSRSAPTSQGRSSANSPWRL